MYLLEIFLEVSPLAVLSAIFHWYDYSVIRYKKDHIPHVNKGLWQCWSFKVEKGNAFLVRKQGQGAGACRHNRIQDTLLQPYFITVIITFPLSPWWPIGLPLPLTFLKHTRIQLAKQTLQTGIRTTLQGELWSWLCAVGIRKRNTASEGGGQDVSVGKSIKKRRP